MNERLKKYDNLPVEDLHKALAVATGSGLIEDVKYIFTSPNVKNNNQIDIHYKKDVFLQDSCRFGRLDVIKYLLTSPDLKQHSFINIEDDYPFQLAAMNGHFEVVRYLAASPELKTHSNVTNANNVAFQYACQKGHVDIVEYLLTSTELKEHPDIYAKNDDGLKLACINSQLEVLRYLVFDFNLQRTEIINKKLNLYANEEIEKLFKLREVHDNLERDLAYNDIKNKKNKI
jgi:ankyrin repeat protein